MFGAAATFIKAWGRETAVTIAIAAFAQGTTLLTSMSVGRSGFFSPSAATADIKTSPSVPNKLC